MLVFCFDSGEAKHDLNASVQISGVFGVVSCGSSLVSTLAAKQIQNSGGAMGIAHGGIGGFQGNGMLCFPSGSIKLIGSWRAYV
jgi:hypothetical protein